MTNIGNSPANHVNIDVWMDPWLQERQPKNLLKEKCAAIGRPIAGFTLFPDERFPRDKAPLGGWSAGAQAARAYCDAAVSEGTNPKKIVSLFVYGCITYTFSSDPIGRHQTRFIYEVGRNPTAAPFRPYITVDDGVISQSDLYLLEPSIGFGQEAD